MDGFAIPGKMSFKDQRLRLSPAQIWWRHIPRKLLIRFW